MKVVRAGSPCQVVWHGSHQLHLGWSFWFLVELGMQHEMVMAYGGFHGDTGYSVVVNRWCDMVDHFSLLL